jgi:hypothetical protein
LTGSEGRLESELARELAAVPVMDQHCHGLCRSVATVDLLAWRRLFTESSDPEAADAVPTTAFYRRLLRRLAAFLGCEPTETTVLRERGRRETIDLVGALLRDARVETVLVDRGYPTGDLLPDADVEAAAACRVRPLLRLEPLLEGLVARHGSLSDVAEALRHELADVRARGFAGLKSIVAYRTGLDIEHWDDDAVAASFIAARLEAHQRGGVRLGWKPLLDTLLALSFSEAAEQELPVQFHVGYGDHDADLRLANPLHLRRVLETPSWRGMTVVLLHGCYPFTREGAVLTAIYGNVVLDLSYGIPFLSLAELRAVTRAALAAAPASRVVYSSDGLRVPELHWMSAHDARSVLAKILAEAVAEGELTPADATATANAVLRGNATRLYRLAGPSGP